LSQYLDTGLLAKLYVPEPNTPAVVTMVRSQTDELAYNDFHDLELRNALRAKLFRKEIDGAQLNGALANVEADLRTGALLRTPFDWSRIRLRADALSQRFTPLTGCRTLDILHVAAALESTPSRFLTGDQRQADFAKRAGLQVVFI
jgi:predicted nucleic acid-binding protein